MAAVDILTPADVEAIVERVLTKRERIEEWLTVPDYALRMTMPKSTVYAFIREGRIPSKRIGRSLRVPTSALR